MQRWYSVSCSFKAFWTSENVTHLKIINILKEIDNHDWPVVAAVLVIISTDILTQNIYSYRIWLRYGYRYTNMEKVTAESCFTIQHAKVLYAFSISNSELNK